MTVRFYVGPDGDLIRYEPHLHGGGDPIWQVPLISEETARLEYQTYHLREFTLPYETESAGDVRSLVMGILEREGTPQ